MPVLLSTSAAAKLTGATTRMIDHWARTGLIHPSGQAAKGKGSKRRFTFSDIIALQTICKLREGNCPLQKIRTAIRYLRSNYPDGETTAVLARLTLLTDGVKVYLLTDETQVMDVVSRQFQIGWVVSIGKLILDTTRRLEQMPQSWMERFIVSGQPFQFRIERTEAAGGYIAQCNELPGALCEGASADEAVKKLKAAVANVLTHAGSSRAKHGQKFRKMSNG